MVKKPASVDSGVHAYSPSTTDMEARALQVWGQSRETIKKIWPKVSFHRVRFHFLLGVGFLFIQLTEFPLGTRNTKCGGPNDQSALEH